MIIRPYGQQINTELCRVHPHDCFAVIGSETMYGVLYIWPASTVCRGLISQARLLIKKIFIGPFGLLTQIHCSRLAYFY